MLAKRIVPFILTWKRKNECAALKVRMTFILGVATTDCKEARHGFLIWGLAARMYLFCV
jgi:hypothetical protein